MCELPDQRKVRILRKMGDTLLKRRSAPVLEVACDSDRVFSGTQNLIVFFQSGIDMRAAVFVGDAQDNLTARILLAAVNEDWLMPPPLVYGQFCEFLPKHWLQNDRRGRA